MATALVVAIIGITAAFGAAPVGAEHPEDAPDYTEEQNYTIDSVSEDDHHPGQDEGSMRYWSAGEESFEEEGTEEGIYIDYIITHADWLDFSDCDTKNAAAFGIDRGNNNSGTEYDEDLVEKVKESKYRDNGVTIEFFNHEDVAGDPPYIAPEDAVVAEQGENSAGGGCIGVTEEEGWYQITGFMNGTEADNGPDEEPSGDAKEGGSQAGSTYFYVCECEDEEEAEEELGAPPGETAGGAEPGEDGDGDDDGGEETEQQDEEQEETEQQDEEQEETEQQDEEQEETEQQDEEQEETEQQEGAEDGGDDGAGDGGAGDDGDQPAVEDDGEDTPESDDQPGFGPIAALVALLASALLLYRRD